MSEVSMSAQQLAQALAQLNKAAASSPLARQAMDVLVKHITHNSVFLADPRTNKTLQLPTRQLSGQLVEGQHYQTKLSSDVKSTALNFYTGDTSTSLTRQLMALTQQNIAQILQHLDTKSQLAPVGPSASQPLVIKGTVTRIQANQVTVQYSHNGKTTSATIRLDNPSQHLTTGQSVTLSLQPTKTGWDVALLLNKGVGLASNTTTTQSQQLAKIAAQSNTIPQVALSAPKQALIQTLQTQIPLLPKTVISQLHSAPGDQVVLEKKDGQWSLSIPQQKAVASLNLDAKTIKNLENLGVSLPRNEPSKPDITAAPTRENNQPTAVNTTTHVKDVGKEAVKTSIEQLLRRLEPQQIQPAQSVNKLAESLASLTNLADKSVNTVVSEVAKQLNTQSDAKSAVQPESLKQIFSYPGQALSASNLLGPQSNGLLGGLMTLLQVSLSSRLIRQQPQLSERVQQVVSQILASRSGNAPATSVKGIQDFGQQDLRNGILRDLVNLLSHHQTSKLVNAEQSLQGQDSFYYLLPSAFGNAAKEIELLIKREQHDQSKRNKSSGQQKSWHLTMKLPVGDYGEMLTKARLTDVQLDVDFYTSNDQLKRMILEFLPLLKKRFSSLGIELGQTQCQLGRIPDTLKERPYRIFETQA